MGSEMCIRDRQLVSFTITEKGYALQKADGSWFPFVENDIKNGPEQVTGAMAVLVAMLLERYKAGKYPLALVSICLLYTSPSPRDGLLYRMPSSA